MSEPFLSEIKICAFNFPPKGWALANGQLLPINQNQALFALLGTRYGGNGQTNFALPNLRGRVPIHMSADHTLGEAAGSSAVTINIQQLPTHTHVPIAINDLAPADDSGVNVDNTKLPAQPQVSTGVTTVPGSMYGTTIGGGVMKADAITNVGGSQPHNNMMPYLVLNFIIALQGIFPSQN
ncbi:MAG: phage tail protein [Alphaproteobacteria bacterium]|nr:MAG: phage tail protein [Alphaproteobacteria bacterium]